MGFEQQDPDTERAFARMQRDLPRVAPRADLFDEIAAALPGRAEEPAAAPAPVARARRRLRRPSFAIPAGVAVAALVAALVIARAVSGGPSPDASAPIVPHGTNGVSGRAELFDPSSSDGRLVVHLKGLAVAPAGDHYTIWVLRDGVREMTPVASVVSADDSRLELPLPGPGRYTALDISLQRNDASAAHSGRASPAPPSRCSAQIGCRRVGKGLPAWWRAAAEVAGCITRTGVRVTRRRDVLALPDLRP